MSFFFIKKLYRNNELLFWSFLFSLVFLSAGILFPQSLIGGLNSLNTSLLSIFSSYYLVLGLLIVLLALGILISPLRKKRLGEAKPEYSGFSWIALLYSTGMGSGLLLRAVQEPVYYFNNPPVLSENASQMALQYNYFHWGFTPWAFYSVFGLIVAYNLYVKKAPDFLHAILPGVKTKWLSTIAQVLTIFITITGVIASLGLGTGQFIGGINEYFQLKLDSSYLVWTALLIGIAATLSALTGIQKVIKILADFDMIASIALMVFIGLFLNFVPFIRNTSLAFFKYVFHFFEMSLSIGAFKTTPLFLKEWTVFYWAFWLAWVPFTGIFIARISKGRTIRDFIIATILVPTLATIIWFSVFANHGFEIIKSENIHQFDNVFTSLFVFLQHFPFSSLTVMLAIVLVLIAIINSVDSAIFVLGMFSDRGQENPSMVHKSCWGIIITAMAVGITSVGTSELLNAISNLLIIMSLPFSFLYLFVIFTFLRSITKTYSSTKVSTTVNSK